MNVLNGMMNNWDKIKKFQTEYKQGMMVGSSEKENARYIDSIEGKITKLKNNIANLATTIFSSNMFKGLLDGANAFIEGLTKVFSALDKVHLALPTVIAGFLAFKSVIAKLAGEKAGGATVKVIEGIGKAIGAISKEGSVIGGLSSALNGAFTSMGASATLASAGVSALGTVLGVLGVALVGGAIIKGIDYYNDRFARMAEASRTRQEEIKGEMQAQQQQIGSLSQLAGRYDELNRKVNRTKSEEKELLGLRQQIADISPDLVAGYTAQGDPILKLNGSLENTVKLMQQQYEWQQKVLQAERENEIYANYENDKKLKQKNEQAKNKLQATEDKRQASGNGYDTTNWSSPVSDKNNGGLKEWERQRKEQLKAYNDYIQEINKNNAELRKSSATAGQYAFDTITSNDKYLKTTEKNQSKINQLMSGFEWGNLSPEKQKAVANQLASTNKQFGDSGFNVEKFNKRINDLTTDYATGAISQDRYNNSIKNLAKELNASGIDISVEDLSSLLKKIPQDVDLAQRQLGAFLKANGKLTSQIGIDVETTNLVNARDTVTDAIDRITKLDVKKDQKVLVDLLPDIANQADMPVQINGAIEAIMADGVVGEYEKELLIDILTQWQNDGTVDQEKIDELMQLDGKQITPEIKAKMKTEGFETYQQFLDKDVNLQRELVAKCKVENKEEYDKAMEEAGDNETKKKEIIAQFEARGQEVMDNVFSIMDELGISGDQAKKDFMANLKVAMEKNGMSTSDLADVQSFTDFLIEHPEVQTLLGIKVDKDGQASAEEVKDTVNDLDGKEAKVKVDAEGADETNGKLKEVDENCEPKEKKVTTTETGSTETKNKLQSVDQNTKPVEKKVKTDDGGTTDATNKKLQTVNEFANPITKGVTTTESGSSGVVSRLQSVDKNAKPVTKKAKATQTGAQQVVSWLQKIQKQPGTKQHKTKATQSGCSSVLGAIKSIMSQPSTKTITTTFRKITENVTKFITQGKKGGKGKSSLSAPEQVSKSAFDTEADLSTQTYESASIVTDTIADQVEDMVADQQEAIQRSLPTMMFDAQAIYSSTSVSPSDGNNVIASIQFDIELFKELQDELKELANQANLVNAKMENAFGTNKIGYLKQQISLLQTQSQLQAKQLEYYKQEQAVLKRNLQSYGFAFNGEDITNYESLLLAKERELESLEKTANAEGASDAQKKAYENARKNYDNMKKVLQEYYEIESQGLYETQQAIEENTAKIREYQNQIEQLSFENEIRREINAINDLNLKLEMLGTRMDKLSIAKDNAYGRNKINLMREEISYLYEEIRLNKELQNQYTSQMKDYQNKLRQYGAIFNDDGTLATESLLERYANTADYDKIAKWAEEYNNLVKELNKVNGEINTLTDNISDLNYEARNMGLDLKIESINAQLYKTNQIIDKLNNKIDILDTKLEYANGYEKLDLIKQQIEAYKALEREQSIALDVLKESERSYRSILQSYGVIFDSNNNITNMTQVIGNISDSREKEYFDKVLEQWEELANESIPEAEKAILGYQNSVKDALKDQLNITKEIEDKLTEIYKQQLDDRKKLLEEQTNKLKTELEKQKEAYNNYRKDVEYNTDYADKNAEIEKLKSQIARLEMDDTLSNRKRIEELKDQLKEAQKDLSDLVQDKLDTDINDMYDEQIESVDSQYEAKIKQLEEMWSDLNIAEAVKNALGSGVFTDVDGNVRNLQDTLLEFAETSGEALGVMGDIVKNEIVGNLQIALDTVKQYDEIMKNLDIEQMKTLTSNNGATNSTTNNYTIGDTTFNIKSNDTEGIMNELKAYVDAKFNEIADGNR